MDKIQEESKKDSKGLCLARAYFEAYGLPMLEKDFSDILPHVACGLFGSGSECFGYDDAISTDHDFEPGFLILLPGEDVVDRRRAFLLERAYAKLPREFMGFSRSLVGPVGGLRHGVIRLEDLLTEKTGAPDGALSLGAWLSLPDQSLAEMTNGEVFWDGPGDLSRIRAKLAFFPEDIRKKKLAGHLLLMAQAGQYNYLRCLGHGETGAAQLAVGEFCKSAMAAAFLLNRRYQPYYKWSFRAMRALPDLSLDAELLEYLLTSGNEEEAAQEKSRTMETIGADVIDLLIDQGLTRATCGDLEKHAYSVNDSIEDSSIRNLHILAAV